MMQTSLTKTLRSRGHVFSLSIGVAVGVATTDVILCNYNSSVRY